MAKEATVMLLFTGVNKREALNVLKIRAYVGLLKSTANPPWGPPEAGACERPNPGVLNWLPRVFRNTRNGFTGAVVSTILGLPPSQLISRRPFIGSGPGLLRLLSPKEARNASTVLWIDAASGPAAWNTTGPVTLPGGRLCACAVWLAASTIDTKPRAVMVIEVIGSFIAACLFDLVTDCLVCMVLSF